MSTVEKIQAEIDALDVGFDSPENVKTGRLALHQYQKRRVELCERLNSAERAEMGSTKKAAPALTEPRLNELFRPPQLAGLPAADRAELDAFTRNFDAALRDGDLQTARTIEKSPRRASLAQTAQIAHIAQSLKDTYDQNGAKIFAALMTGAVAALYQELHETRLTVRLQRAHSERLERMILQRSGVGGLDGFDVDLTGRTLTFALRCGDRIVKRGIKLPLPIFRGVYRSGEKYEQSDVVVFGGSQWIALRDTDTRPPGAHWQCCVQRGKDATR